jgi:hypothetical protein
LVESHPSIAHFLRLYYNPSVIEQELPETQIQQEQTTLSGNNIFHRKLSRRNLIAGGVAAAVGIAFAGKEIEDHAFGEQNNIWREAAKENGQFYEDNKDVLSHISFGTSFAPEMFGDMSLQQMNSDPFIYGRNRDRMLQALDVVIKDFGIKDIRLGIRWDNAVLNNQINPILYDDIIRKCIDNEADITLNYGAIKTFRWPEEHVPEHVMQTVATPPQRGLVSNDGELAKHATDYAHNLLMRVKGEYGEDGEDRIKAIQPENEGFNQFGNKKWTMGKEYYKNIIGVGHDIFPNASILLNSSGGDNLGQIREVFTEVESNTPQLRGKLTAGVDFYFDTPSKLHLPGVHPAVDPITFSKLKNPFSKNDFDRHMEEAKRLGIITEITEGETEKYGYITHPQEKAQSFRFWVLRTAPYTDGMMRIWGIEEFAKRRIDGELTSDNWKVLDFVRTIQEKSS